MQPAAGARMEGDQMVTPKGFKHPKWYRSELHAWSLVAEGGTMASIALDDANPLNDQTPHSLRLDVEQTGRRAGVANEGFLILFDVADADNLAQWNIGGWGNTRSAVEQKEGGANR